MLLGRAHDIDSVTNVCLPLQLWEFLVFPQASKTLCNNWWCRLYSYTKGQTHWRESIDCSDSFTFAPLTCFPSACQDQLIYPRKAVCILWVRSTGAFNAFWTTVQQLCFIFIPLVCCTFTSFWPLGISWPAMIDWQEMVFAFL